MASVLDIEGVASLALLSDGGISGHLIDKVTKKCYGILGKEIKCERECSRGEDYKLVELSIIDFTSKKECTMVAEQRGADAARIKTAEDAHGWEEEVLEAAREGHRGAAPQLTFDCETLKADADAERHIQKFLPALEGQDAVINVGKMSVKGLKFEEKKHGTKRGYEYRDIADERRGDEGQRAGKSGRIQTEIGGGEGDGVGTKWRLEKGSNGEGWFTRRPASGTESTKEGSVGSSDRCSREVGSLEAGEREQREADQKLQEERMESYLSGPRDDHEGGRHINGAGVLGNAQRSAIGILDAKLRSIEQVIGLPSQGAHRPAPISRQVLQEESRNDDWL